jgi:hypothetical protein
LIQNGLEAKLTRPEQPCLFHAYNCLSDTNLCLLVSAWTSGSSEPLWSVPLPIKLALPDGQITIFVTDDGSKILLIVTQLAPNPQNLNPRLYWFTNVGTARPTVGYADLPAGAGARDMACSTNGQYAAVSAGAFVYVYDTVNKRMRSSINFGFSTVALCLSPDGQFLGHGFTTMYFYQWNSNNYTLSGSYAPGQATLHVTGQCAISTSGVAAVAWTTGNYLQKIVSAHSLKSGKASLLFKYSFNENQNTRYQDLISGIAMSSDGSVFGFSSWGDGGDAPTVTIFKTATGASGPIYTMATVGSMNDIDLYVSGNYIYASAGGKAVHNNIMGDGGVLVALQVPLAGAPPS